MSLFKVVISFINSLALSLQPGDALVYKRRADIRGKLSMKTEALNDYKKAIFIQTQRMQVISYFLNFPLIIDNLICQINLAVIS